ncbi:hypothetical protein ElyMa_002857200 [Elysia marginata]|uniref:Endonuclease/exonuclease/phosphatase domain-containing protein n=1 Tax=Elysia marginata TaxID=1093978 RepID=A0AAV4HZN8_9GAST|nr:hypothetical protein ElyMa_002857200 [Elysia marginata]
MVMQTSSCGYDFTSMLSSQAEVVPDSTPNLEWVPLPPNNWRLLSGLYQNSTLKAVETYRSRPDGETGGEDPQYLMIEVILPTDVLHLNNIYSHPNKDFRLKPKVTKGNFIVMLDCNSHSPSWGYDTLDSKGEKVEDWAIHNQLILLTD